MKMLFLLALVPSAPVIAPEADVCEQDSTLFVFPMLLGCPDDWCSSDCSSFQAAEEQQCDDAWGGEGEGRLINGSCVYENGCAVDYTGDCVSSGVDNPLPFKIYSIIPGL